MNQYSKTVFRRLRHIKSGWQLLLFCVPAVVLVIIFNYMPMYGIKMAFQDYKPALGFANSKWVGFKHFARFLKSSQSTKTITNTVLLSFFSLLVSFPLPVILALMINQIRPRVFKKTVQTVTYLPYFISTVVAVSVLTLFLSPTRGVYGMLMRTIGIENPTNLLLQREWFRPLYILSNVWQTTGYSSIIYLAALSSVDPQLHEAAIIDGANKVQRIFAVDIPAILPTTVIMLIMACGSLMNVGFEKVYLMQNPLNLSTSEVIQTYLYKMGMDNAQYSFSAAISLFNTTINVVLLIIVNWIAGKLGDTTLF